jgi:hypothetical protein
VLVSDEELERLFAASEAEGAAEETQDDAAAPNVADGEATPSAEAAAPAAEAVASDSEPAPAGRFALLRGEYGSAALASAAVLVITLALCLGVLLGRAAAPPPVQVAAFTPADEHGEAFVAPIATPTRPPPSPTPTFPPSFVRSGAMVMRVESTFTIETIDSRKPAKPNHTWLQIVLELSNIGGADLQYNVLFFKLRDARGVVYSPQLTGAMAPQLTGGFLPGRQSVLGVIGFEVPEGMERFQLGYEPFVGNTGVPAIWLPLDGVDTYPTPIPPQALLGTPVPTLAPPRIAR